MREADAKPNVNHAGVGEGVRRVIQAGVFGAFKALGRF